MRNLLIALVTLACFTASAGADYIGFSQAEGYDYGPLNGQPSSGGTWSCTSDCGSNIFNVWQSGSPPHMDSLLSIYISGQHGPSSELVTPDYATKRMIPVTEAFTATFTAAFTFSFNGQGDSDQQTSIALGQASDSGWGPYLGLNKTSATSLAAHDGAGWTELITGLAFTWYDVEITGDIDTDLFDLTLYREDQRDAGDPSAGRLLQVYGLAFRDSPTELAYVMLTNEGSSKDTGAYSQLYDDLMLIPEPASLYVLAVGAMALIRRRRK